MVWTGGTPAPRRNQIRNCTCDAGKGDPGAIGVRVDASNAVASAIASTSFRATQGVIGLDMSYADDFGPCSRETSASFGFDTGIATKYGVNGDVFENVTLKNQRRTGGSTTDSPSLSATS